MLMGPLLLVIDVVGRFISILVLSMPRDHDRYQRYHVAFSDAVGDADVCYDYGGVVVSDCGGVVGVAADAATVVMVVAVADYLP